MNVQFSEFFKLYKIFTLLHRSKLNILQKKRFENERVSERLGVWGIDPLPPGHVSTGAISNAQVQSPRLPQLAERGARMPQGLSDVSGTFCCSLIHTVVSDD